jgi:DNA-binding CsgD family transcriptional regulator
MDSAKGQTWPALIRHVPKSDLDYDVPYTNGLEMTLLIGRTSADDPDSAIDAGPGTPMLAAGVAAEISTSLMRLPLVVPSRIIGRQADMRKIQLFLEQAACDGRALVVRGAPGMGKSALLNEGVEMARAAGTRVIRVMPASTDSDIAFLSLSQLLLPLWEEMSRLDPIHSHTLRAALGLRDGDASTCLTVASATLLLLKVLATERPLLMAIDDAQWLDHSTAVVLNLLARRVEGSGIGVLVAERPGHENAFESRGLPDCDLQPLDDLAADGLIRACHPGLSDQVRRRLLHESKGNPLALMELPSCLTDVQRRGSRPLPATLPLSPRLLRIYGARLRMLPAECSRILLLVSYEGTGDLRSVLRAAGGQDKIQDLVPAEREGLVRIDLEPSRIFFRHPLVRSAVVEGSTVDERRWALLALAEQFADQPDRRADLLAHAAVEPDENVAALLESSAYRELNNGYVQECISALLRSAELSPDRSASSRRLAAAAYVEGNRAGDRATAVHLLAESRRADPHGPTGLHFASTEAFLMLNGEGDAEAAFHILTEAIAQAVERQDRNRDALVAALNTLSFVCSLSGRRDFWESLHDITSQMQDCPSGTFSSVLALGHPQVAELADLERSIRGLVNFRTVDEVIGLGAAALSVDRASGCRVALSRIATTCKMGGDQANAVMAFQILGMDNFFAGEWDETAKHAAEGAHLLGRGRLGALAWQFSYQGALVAAGRGDLKMCRELTDEILTWASPRKAKQAVAAAHHARLLADLGQGDFEGAYAHASAISPAGALGCPVAPSVWVALDLVESAMRTGRTTEAAAHVTLLRKSGIANISERASLLVKAAEALAAPDGGGRDCFEAALCLPGVGRWPFELARVQLAYGERLRRARASSAAKAVLTSALETFQRLRAEPWIARAASELRAAGYAEGDNPKSADLGALTAQERQVALLAATGLTNKQIADRLFISPRTVGAHLYRVFPKLGIASRAALRDALRGSSQHAEVTSPAIGLPAEEPGYRAR